MNKRVPKPPIYLNDYQLNVAPNINTKTTARTKLSAVESQEITNANTSARKGKR